MDFQDAEFSAAVAAPLDRTLRERFEGASWNSVRKLVQTGKVRVDGRVVTDPQHVVPQGAAVTLLMRSPRPVAGVADRNLLVHVDPHVVVVRKPAGIATVPHEDERDTLDRVTQSLLRKVARPGSNIPPLGVVQRLDKETSGLLVFARTTSAKRHLQQQLREHSVHRRYVALAHGAVPAKVHRSLLVQDRGDGIRGSALGGNDLELGREAVTHVTPLASLAGATLVACRLETGRTHQIRIHLAEAGHPLLGERVYVRGFKGQQLAAPRVMLHAAELGFVHPQTGQKLHFEEPMPEDMASVLAALKPR
jgi:23S rRNA pseudouridine1911/1915/1917 synthase